MGKYTKSAKKASQNATLYIGIAALVILGLVAITVIALRDTGDLRGSSEILAVNQEIDVQEAYRLHQEGVFTLDVRTAEEYQAGHIPGAVLIPLEELVVRVGELPVGEPILIYCQNGNRSLQAMNMLGDAAFRNLSSMKGGFNVWVSSEYPVAYP